jgi:hypothetical protein
MANGIAEDMDEEVPSNDRVEDIIAVRVEQ